MVKNDRFVSMAVWYARHNAEGAGWFQPNTPKALANLSAGWSGATTLGTSL